MKWIIAACTLSLASSLSIGAEAGDFWGRMTELNLPIGSPIPSLSLSLGWDLSEGFSGTCVQNEYWMWAKTPSAGDAYNNISSSTKMLLPYMCDSYGQNPATCSTKFKLIGKTQRSMCSPWTGGEAEFENITIPARDTNHPNQAEIRVAMMGYNADGSLEYILHPDVEPSIVIGVASSTGGGGGGDDDGTIDATEDELRTLVISRSDRNVPFSTVVRLGFEHRRAVRRVKNIQWRVSSDGGGTWSTPSNPNGTPITRARISKRFLERAHLIYKATYELDGETYETNEGHVYALVEPKVRIDGPNVTYTSYPITLTGVITNGIPGDLKWQVFTNKDRKIPLIEQDGPSITLQGLGFGGYIVKLLSTENPAYFEGHAAKGYAQQVVMVIPDKEVVSPEIKGLRDVKVGKSYHYTARLPGPFSTAKARHDLTISGVWALPDGTTQEGPHLVVQPTAPGEIEATFSGRVDQLPHIAVVGSLKLRATEYVWPAWVMATEVKGTQVPVRVTAVAKMSEVKEGRAGIGDEVPQYQWILPEGARVVSERGNLVIVDLAKAGDAQLQVKVFDTLGHETMVSSDMIPVAASDPDFQIDAVAAFADGNDLAPGRILFRLSVLKTPKNDAFKTFRVYDGEAMLGETAQKILTLPFNGSGTYRLTLEAETKFGVIKQREVVVTLRPAPQPSCSLSLQGQTSLAWKLQASCTVSEGTISSINWAFGDRSSTGTTKLMEIRKADFPSGVDVTVTGTTNKGLSASASLRVDPPTQ